MHVSKLNDTFQDDTHPSTSQFQSEFGSTSKKLAISDKKSENIPTELEFVAFLKAIKNEINNLGKLDGIVSCPDEKMQKVKKIDSRKITAILLETNLLELQRHLLTTTVHNHVRI